MPISGDQIHPALDMNGVQRETTSESRDSFPNNSSLKEIYINVVTKANDAIKYYQTKKMWPRRCARIVRVGAIVLISAAGIVPLLDAAGLFSGLGIGVSTDSGQIALVVAAMAAALLASDRFYGFSSSWARFTTNELALQRALDSFIFDWELSLALEDTSKDRRELTANRLNLLKNFSMEVSQLNEDETRVWVAEYQNALVTLERFAGQQKEQLQPGTLQIAVERTEKVKGPVRILLNGQVRRDDAGDMVIIRPIMQGQHLLEVTAQNEGGNELRETRVVDILSNETIRLNVKLG